MTLLAFSTSSEMLSVALFSDSQLIKEENHFLGLKHSEKLLPTIKDILGVSSFSLKDIDAFAVDVGPGSFTGLRIGLATLKGLTFGERKKVSGVLSLDALAENVNSLSEVSLRTEVRAKTLVCPVIDAKQERVYSAIYEITKSGRLKRKIDYSVIKIKDLLKKLNRQGGSPRRIQKTIFLGDGLEKYQDFIARAKKDVSFLPREFWFPYASVIAKLGLERLKRGKSDDINSLSPRYLIPPIK